MHEGPLTEILGFRFERPGPSRCWSPRGSAGPGRSRRSSRSMSARRGREPEPDLGEHPCAHAVGRPLAAEGPGRARCGIPGKVLLVLQPAPFDLPVEIRAVLQRQPLRLVRQPTVAEASRRSAVVEPSVGTGERVSGTVRASSKAHTHPPPGTSPPPSRRPPGSRPCTNVDSPPLGDAAVPRSAW